MPVRPTPNRVVIRLTTTKMQIFRIPAKSNVY